MQPIPYILFFIFCLSQQTLSQGTIHSLDSLGQAAYDNKQTNKALDYYQKMLEKIEKENNFSTHLQQIKQAAFLYLRLGQYESAELLYLKLIQYQQKIDRYQNPLQTESLGQLAYCYFGMGRYEEAESYYLEALALGKKVLKKDAAINTSNLSNLAALYTTMRRYEEAEQIYLQVLELDKKNSYSKQDYAISLNNLATLYHETKRYTEAKKLYLESQKIQKEIYGDDQPNYALSLNNLAALYESMHANEEAEKLYVESRKILGKNNPHYIHSLNSSAKLYYKQKNYLQAEKKWLEAKVLTENDLGAEHPAFAQCLDNLAKLYLQTQRLDSAWTYCLKGLAANSKELKSSVDWTKLETATYYSNERASESIATLLAISKAIYEENKNKENLKNIYYISKLGMQINERIRNDFTSNNNKLRILAQNNNFVYNGIKAIVELNDPALFAEAFTFAEQNKSILLLDAIKGQRARALGDLPDSLVLLELNLQNQKESLQQEQYKTNSSLQKAELTASINALNLEINAFVNSIKDKYPNYHAVKYEQLQTDVEAIQGLIDNKTLLLEYFVGEEQSFLFVISKAAIKIITIKITKEQLNTKIRTLRSTLNNYTKFLTSPKEAYLTFTQSADWMYKELLGKALENQQANRLIIITDGELGHLPFEVFLKTSPPQVITDYNKLDYLVKHYNISYNYSVSLWKENLKSSKKSLQKEKKQALLAFASTYEKTNQNTSGLRSKEQFQLRQSLEFLPAAQKEVEMLSKSFRGRFLLGKEANESNFKQLATNYSVIHLAMHGVLNESLPALSALAFSEDFSDKEDNFLQAYEISQLELNADLVVLSACQTGYGQFKQGEGIISLARSFMYAGVPSLVVSLWQVNDQATAILMSFFYQNLTKKMPKDEALRQAKLKYLNTYTGSASHPALWSAFIQLGDNQAISLDMKRRLLLPLIIGIALFVLGFCFWKYKK